MNYKDNIRLAYNTIRSNKLRTGITVTIIAFGIMALVGIRTAIEAMQQKFVESFSSMGASGFTIRYIEPRFIFRQSTEVEDKTVRKEKKSNQGRKVTKEQAEKFKENYEFPATVGITLYADNDAVVSFASKKSNPTTRVQGGDENYLELNGLDLAFGRNLNRLDVQSGRNVCIIGSDVAKRFFGESLERPVGAMIKVNNIPYRVIGTLEEKGTVMGMSRDNVIVTSYENARKFYDLGNTNSFQLMVKVKDVNSIDAGVGEAKATFRPIRKLTTFEEDNFAIDKSDSFVEMLMTQLGWLTGAALIIGLITLLGAAIGLMNIMLVAVTERTKEIGLIKAIGGKQKTIRNQFLFESVIISLLGAFFGVILGVLVGNIFSIFMSTGFVVPWGWMIFGIFICSLVGLLSGIYPALKASRLRPIEALRYE